MAKLRITPPPNFTIRHRTPRQPKPSPGPESSKKRELLTEDTVELLTSPFELAEYKNAIMDAMYKGTKRHVESEDEPSKNAQVG